MESNQTLDGLTSADAAARLKQYGPNAIPETKPHPVLNFLKHFWGPIPWLLEVIILLQLFLGKIAEAIIIAVLVLFNSIVSSIQEKRSADALSMLRQNLQVTARSPRWAVGRPAGGAAGSR